MVDLIKEQPGLPVNSDGEVVAVIGTGGRSVAGALNPNNIPVDANGNMVVNLATAEGGSVVTAKTNSLTGRIKKVQSGQQAMFEPLLCGKRATLVRPYYYGNTSGNANVTRHGALVLPIKPFAAKMRMLNVSQSSIITMQGAITSAQAIDDDLGNSLSWSRFKFAGANTVAMPVGTNGVMPASLFSMYDSDLLTLNPSAYDIGTVLMYRTHALEADNTFLAGSMAVAAMTLASSGMRGYFQTGVDAVTTPTAMTSPAAHASLPPCGLILYHADDVVRISVYGSSTASGTGDTVDAGWANRAQRLMSTDSLAYIFASAAASGSTTQNAIKRFDAEMALWYAPDVAIYNVYSPNDSDVATAAALSRLQGQVLYFVDECRRRGIVPVLQCAQAGTGHSGNTLTNRRSVNDFARAIAENGDCRLLDLASLLTDETVSTGAWKDPSLTSDGLHPTSDGHALIAQLAASVCA